MRYGIKRMGPNPNYESRFKVDCINTFLIFFSFFFQTVQSGDCEIENSTVKLLNSLEATRVTYAKCEKRKKSVTERDEEYEKLRQLLTYEEV